MITEQQLGRPGKRRQSRFTLVEIMIVVAIIGLLIGIAVPSFITARTNSRKSACIDNLRLIDGAKEQWALENNKAVGETCIITDLLGNYIKTEPKCGANGVYTVNPIGTTPTCSESGQGHIYN